MLTPSCFKNTTLVEFRSLAEKNIAPQNLHVLKRKREQLEFSKQEVDDKSFPAINYS